jgi:hypothetical protein
MIRLVLSGPLRPLVAIDLIEPKGGLLDLDTESWAGVVQLMRDRYPRLAARVLTDDDLVVPGFLVAVNAEVRPTRITPQLGDGDEICLIAQMAGG